MSSLTQKVLRDALAQLGGWTGDAHQIHRTLELDEAQHADLTERIKVFADAMHLRPLIRRYNGRTEIRLGGPEQVITATEVAFAARVEDAYRTVTQSS